MYQSTTLCICLHTGLQVGSWSAPSMHYSLIPRLLVHHNLCNLLSLTFHIAVCVTFEHSCYTWSTLDGPTFSSLYLVMSLIDVHVEIIVWNFWFQALHSMTLASIGSSDDSVINLGEHECALMVLFVTSSSYFTHMLDWVASVTCMTNYDGVILSSVIRIQSLTVYTLRLKYNPLTLVYDIEIHLTPPSVWNPYQSLSCMCWVLRTCSCYLSASCYGVKLSYPSQSDCLCTIISFKISHFLMSPFSSFWLEVWYAVLSLILTRC